MTFVWVALAGIGLLIQLVVATWLRRRRRNDLGRTHGYRPEELDVQSRLPFFSPSNASTSKVVPR